MYVFQQENVEKKNHGKYTLFWAVCMCTFKEVGIINPIDEKISDD